MKKLLTILLLFFTAHSFAQEWGAPPGSTFKRSHRDTLGVSYMRVMYSHKYMPDTLARDNFDKYAAVLHVCKDGLSKYEEYAQFLFDSLVSLKTKNYEILVEDYNAALKKVGNFRSNGLRLYKNHPERGKILNVEYTGIVEFYYYTQDKPQFNWSVRSDSIQTILEHQCMYAEGQYAGRTWRVWFTPEVPVSEGPWKLCGLPGLILKAEDAKGEFFFNAFAIMNNESAVKECGLSDMFTTKREKFLKLKEKKEVNLKQQFLSSGKFTTSVPVKTSIADIRPYNPIEFY